MDGKKEYQALLVRTEGYAEQVRKLFVSAVNDILALTTSVPQLKDGEVFSYSDNKKIAKKVQDRLRDLHSVVYAAIKEDITLEWGKANEACDGLATTYFGKEILSDKRFAGWFERNTEAMEAFINRKEAGLNLSDRVWKPVTQLRSEMELAMTIAIGEGESASQISRMVRKYLNNPDKLFRRVRDKEGNLKLSKAAKAYHPGQGVYRSSAKNAMRIARSETNIAYRQADNTRWQQMDFVLGQEIQLSRSHPVTDICDTLKGRYPKDFVFTGWHPQCFCFVTPILLSEKDFAAMQQAKLEGKDYDVSDKMVKDMPDNFKSWAIDNKERIEKAKQRGTLPYFIRDNKKTVERIINPPTALEIAKERHAARTPEQIKDIKRRWTLRNAEIRHANRTPEQAEAIRKAWNERKATRKYGNSILSYMNGISDVDTNALQKALAGGSTETILKEARKLKSIGKEILSYTYIENPIQVAKQFSMAEAKAVNEAVQKKLESFAGMALEKQKTKLEFEIGWVEDNKKYATWEIAQKAYQNQLAKVSDALDWKVISDEFANASSFKTKSQPYLDLVSKLQNAIAAKDKTEAQKAIADIQKKREQLDKAAARRTTKKGDIDFAEMGEQTRNKLLSEYDKNTIIEMDDMLRSITSNGWKSLSNEEKRILTKYTQTYSYLNERLRGIPYYGYRTIDEYENDLPILTNALNKFKTTKDMVVRRGTSDYYMPEISKNLSDVKVGDEFTDKGFLSTACHREKGFFQSYELVILVPKGARGIFAEPFSHYTDNLKFDFESNALWDGKSKEYIGGEFEWIGQRGCRFKVFKKVGNRIFVQLIGQLK